MRKTILTMIGLILFTGLFSGGMLTGKNGERFISFAYKNSKFNFENIKVNEFSHEEAAKAYYQLPAELLSQLTTEELILYCGDHPTLAISSGRLKTEAFSNFNGFQELISRDDYFDVLISLMRDNIDSDIEERERFLRFGLSKSLFYTEPLFESLKSNQKIEHLKFLISLSENPNQLKFSPTSAYNFLKACYPEDIDIVITCFKSDDFVYYSCNRELLKEFLDKKIEQLMEVQDE